LSNSAAKFHNGLTALATALMLAACGGGDDDGTHRTALQPEVAAA
jgi:hypothetical protein